MTSDHDLVSAILEDHERAKAAFSRVQAATGEEREEAFRDLVHLLVAHETAEQELVRPLTRESADGDRVADDRLAEEKAAETALAELEKMGCDAPDFDSELAKLRSEVLQHAEREERDEHPRIRGATDPERLRQLAGVYETAKAVAPTHAHPTSPQSPVGNLAVGPVVAIADRVRDALRTAMEKVSG